MQPERFADRLDPRTYAADDEVVGIFEVDAADADAVWCSARLFRRLTGIAVAYELHTLPLLDGSQDVRLDRTRCLSLLDEVVFVAERVDDDLVRALATSVAEHVGARVRRAGWDGTVTVGFD